MVGRVILKGPANYAREEVPFPARGPFPLSSWDKSQIFPAPAALVNKTLPLASLFSPGKASLSFPGRANPCRAIARSRGQTGTPGGGVKLLALDAGTWNGGHVTTPPLPLPKTGAEGVESSLVCTVCVAGQGGTRDVPPYPRGKCAGSYVTLCTCTGLWDRPIEM